MAEPPIALRVRGLRETMRAFRAAPAEARAVLRDELKAAAEPVTAEMRRRAPRARDPRKKSRTNRRSISATIGARVLARGVLVGSSAPHAPIIHFGRRSTQRSASGTPYTRSLHPVPWAYPAVDARREQVRQGLQDALSRALSALFEAGA